MSKAACAFTFTLGAVVGAAVSWGVIKKKYEQIAREEIEDVKRYYSSRKASVESTEQKEEAQEVVGEVVDPDMEMCKEIIKKAGYVNYSDIQATNAGGRQVDKDKPYVITPDEFTSEDDYQAITLVYYADGVLAYIGGDVIEDVEGTVGIESLNHFGEYQDDTVFVRNDEQKCDYEILKDLSKHSELNRRPLRPHEEVED